MRFTFAARMADIDPFRVVEVLARARQLEASGQDIVHLEIGEPDFATAAPICEAAVRALRAGQTGYTQALGLAPLREAIAAWYAGEHGLSIAPERIVVTPGVDFGSYRAQRHVRFADTTSMRELERVVQRLARACS